MGVFSVNTGVNFTVQNLSITNGNSALGGGIANGGITGDGGAIVGGTVTVTNSTFSGNSAAYGGGIATSGTLTVTNTIVANSTLDGNCRSDGVTTDGGHNIDDDGSCGFSGTSLSNTNPMLAGLANNGGPTQTIALCTGPGAPSAGCTGASPAINAGDESVCAAPPVNNLDQRGYVRPGAGATSCSIGAYEYNAAPALPTLAAALSAIATEVLLTDVSAFPDTGTIRIDGEEMTYNGKQLTSGATAHAETAAAQPGMLLNVQRGVNGTIATSHQAGATVVLIVPTCVGDCNGDGQVTVDELLTMVNIALGNTPVTTCEAGDANHDGQITVDEILTAVNNALNGCPAPGANTFTALTATMTAPRAGHTATLLPNGQVLLTGGCGSNCSPSSFNILNTAELYNPVANKFTPLTATMTSARAFHTGTLLSNGKVLITGGASSTTGPALNTAELYDP